jgi:hypothetical protein
MFICVDSIAEPVGSMEDEVLPIAARLSHLYSYPCDGPSSIEILRSDWHGFVGPRTD